LNSNLAKSMTHHNQTKELTTRFLILQMHFPASNNAAEYEALLHGLRIATSLSIH
jgi:ribonuclease HI